MNSYSEKILDAISLVAENKINKANLNKTIQATIVKVEDEAIGKYKIKYQDSYFFAYAMNSEIAYSKDELVNILVPNGDLDKDKFITSAVGNPKTEIQSTLSDSDRYERIGGNCISANEIYGVSSYKEGGDSCSVDLKILNAKDFEEYIKNSTYFTFGASFKTELSKEQQVKGYYELRIILKCLDESTNQSFYKEYSLNINNFSSNPYKLNTYTKQTGYFKIPDNIEEVYAIDLRCNKFPNSKENYQQDIFCKDIFLYGVEKLEDEEIQKTRVVLETPEGTYFNLEDAATAAKTIQATIKIKNRKVSSLDDISFYWFKEDVKIQTGDLKYCNYGGNGWQCLNSGSSSIGWNPASNTLEVQKQDIINIKQRYKCVVVIEENVYESTITLTNYGAEIEISLETDENPIFFYDIGTCVISCLINGEKKTDSNYKYSWVYKSGNGEQTNLTGTSNQITVSAASLMEAGSIICSVYYGEDYWGSANINVYNFKNSSNIKLFAKINNGDQLYQYSEEGLSPSANSLLDPIEIKPLRCSLYTKEGVEVDDKLLDLCTFEWEYPQESTMIENINIIKNMFYYNIKTMFNQDNVNNLISVKIKLKDSEFNAETNLKFIKQGEMGTTGTIYTCQIVPNTNDNFDGFPSFLNGKLNFTPAETGKWFKVQLWKNGTKIYESYESGVSAENENVQIKWSICKNNYNSLIKESNSFYISEDDGLFYYSGYFSAIGTQTSPANLIKAEIIYKGITYYVVQPVVTTQTNYNYTLELVKGTGFNYVQYNSEGRLPQFRDKPFEIKLTYQNKEVTDFSNYTFEWNVRGQVCRLNNFKWEDCILLQEQEKNGLKKNQKYFIPVEEYTGECLSVGLEVKVYTISGTLIGQIHIPIHFYLNKNANSSIAGWDGNSIQIDDDGGFILAPQFGAGKKENDNSFTGMLMGIVRESNSSIEKTGLLSYNKGQQTAFLDAESGGAIFGSNQGGQIAIDPSSDKSLLYSRNYWKNYNEKGFPKNYLDANLNNQGMLIDLDTPEIKYGDGNFKIDKDGNVKIGNVINSDGVLIALVGEIKESLCGYTTGNETYITLPDTMYNIEGTLVSNPTKYPEQVKYVRRMIKTQIFIPENFTLEKAICSIQHVAFKFKYCNSRVTLTDEAASYGVVDFWGDSYYPSYVFQEDTNVYSCYASNYSSPLSIFYVEPEGVKRKGTVAYEGYYGGLDLSSVELDIDNWGSVLATDTKTFENITNNHSNIAKVYTPQSRSLDFTEELKKHIKYGQTNYFAIAPTDVPKTVTLTPYTAIDYQGVTRHKSNVAEMSYVIDANSKCGIVSAIIILYGYYKLD